MLLTEKQLEVAARWLCKQQRRDPDQATMGDSGLIPEWKRIAYEIKNADLIREAIQLGLMTPE